MVRPRNRARIDLRYFEACRGGMLALLPVIFFINSIPPDQKK